MADLAHCARLFLPYPMRRVPVTLREPVNALTHWLGVVLALPLLAVLLGWAQSRDLSLWPFVVFGVSFALLFLASALYHSSHGSARTLAWLRKFDHSAIFLMIAGSYTPVAYFGLSGELRWRLLGLVWGLACTGILLKLITMRLPRWISTALYLGMGWLALGFLPQLARSLPASALVWLGVGGLLYTLGAVVYATKRLDFRPGVFGFHEVWHLFVLAGATAHFVMMFHLR